MSWILGVQHGLGPARPPTAIMPGGATRPPNASLWADASGNITIENDLTVNGATALVGGETFTGLVVVTSAASAGAAGAFGPEEMQFETTQAATAGATIRNPGYVDWEARTWETTGSTSTTQLFGRFGAVIDTITAATGVPLTYRLAWANTAGTLVTAFTEAGVTQVGAGTELLPGLCGIGDTNTGLRWNADDTLTAITNGADRWRVSAAGHLLAVDDATYDIGASGATRPANLFLSGAETLGGQITWSVGAAVTAGSYQVGRDADGTNQLHFNVPTGASYEFSVNDVAAVAITSVGAVQAGAGTEALPGLSGIGDTDTGLRWNADNTLTLITNANDRWRVNAAGHLIAVDDNIYDFGLSGATRPRNVYVSAQFLPPASSVGAPAYSYDSAAGNSGLFFPATNSPGMSAGGVLSTQWNTHSVASAAGATWDGVSNPSQTCTITGAVGITTATGFNFVNIGIPTMSAGSALTITNSASLYLAGAPVGGGAGPATITNAYTLWVDAGPTRIDGNIGFFGLEPIARASAYTQTFATADKTHAAFTSADLATTAATQTSPWGFAGQAQAENIATQFNLLRADVDDVKRLVNSVIDDLQAYGLFQ